MLQTLTIGISTAQSGYVGMPLILGNQQMSMHMVFDVLKAIVLLIIPALVLRGAYVRPDLLDRQVGWIIATLFVAYAIYNLADLFALWTTAVTSTWVLKILAVGVFAFASLQFFRFLPTYRTIPSSDLLAEAHAEAEHQLHLAEDAQAEADLQLHLTEEAQEQNRELDQFAYIASHDLREPLRGVAINADFLLREDLSDPAKKRVIRMIELCKKMETLIADLFKLSRLSNGDRAQDIVNPTEIANDIVHTLSEVLEMDNAHIEVAPDMPLVVGDTSKVRLVFHNLVSNALKYNDSKLKRIEIGFSDSTTVNGDKLTDVFFVRDNGIGMEEKNLDKIFQIFNRLNTEKAYGPGTGAGLSFVKRIIGDYGGVITVTSERGKGTTFYFSIPLAKQVQ